MGSGPPAVHAPFTAPAQSGVMAYTLYRIDPDGFNVLSDGELVGSLIRLSSETGTRPSWRVAVIEGRASRYESRPPFVSERTFRSFDAALKWLGLPPTVEPD